MILLLAAGRVIDIVIILTASKKSATDTMHNVLPVLHFLLEVPSGVFQWRGALHGLAGGG